MDIIYCFAIHDYRMEASMLNIKQAMDSLQEEMQSIAETSTRLTDTGTVRYIWSTRNSDRKPAPCSDGG